MSIWLVPRRTTSLALIREPNDVPLSSQVMKSVHAGQGFCIPVVLLQSAEWDAGVGEGAPNDDRRYENDMQQHQALEAHDRHVDLRHLGRSKQARKHHAGGVLPRKSPSLALPPGSAWGVTVRARLWSVITARHLLARSWTLFGSSTSRYINSVPSVLCTLLCALYSVDT